MPLETIFSANSGVASSPVLQGVLTLFAVAVFLYFFTKDGLYPGFPLIRMEDKAPMSWAKAQKEWNANAHRIVKKGLEQVKGGFQVITAIGPRIILPNKFAEEIRNDPHLSFSEGISKEFFSEYPGFEAFKIIKERDILQEVTRIKLTQSLNFITEDLAEEASSAFKDTIGDDAEWKEITFKPTVMELVARVSSRVFIGPEGCANKEWLAIFKQYTVDSFAAARDLRTWSPLLRPIVHWFLPSCRQLRREMRAARRIVEPIISARRAGAAGGKAAKTADAIGWMDECARGRPFDVAAAQLTLAVAATHTTTDLATLAMFQLCARPEWFEVLRAEVVEVLGRDGWRKAALQRLRLMDSFVKETQRLQHETKAALTRLAKQEVTLSDGTVIPRNSMLMIATEKAMDPAIFPDAEAFDGRRFLDMRERPGQENKWQLVTTSVEHLGFGHGTHACPGRFFAANEIKVLLIFMLMKYDWKFPDGQGMPEMRRFAMEKIVSPQAKLLVRRRKEEIALD
ncbi:putative cytochrome p450 protein [Neofusicoccum parvum UCRNP2]|uniref:Putative cytochrome p450 protein n=1 Tax=Botryosphaeria parva (strain UCR-NP2) TaxID=1287680 RepID=R1GJI9_BOTPV|nr:putative cytochrome p450 protein [Neofusicoccum parvum UCRNP2]